MFPAPKKRAQPTLRSLREFVSMGGTQEDACATLLFAGRVRPLTDENISNGEDVRERGAKSRKRDNLLSNESYGWRARLDHSLETCS